MGFGGSGYGDDERGFTVMWVWGLLSMMLVKNGIDDTVGFESCVKEERRGKWGRISRVDIENRKKILKQRKDSTGLFWVIGHVTDLCFMTLKSKWSPPGLVTFVGILLLMYRHQRLKEEDAHVMVREVPIGPIYWKDDLRLLILIGNSYLIVDLCGNCRGLSLY